MVRFNLQMKNLLAVVIGLLISLIFLEVALRIWQPIKFRVRGDKIVLPVNQRYKINNDKITKLDKVIIHTKNSLGFRGEEPPKDLSNFFSIITVGGSTTECYFMSDDKTWPELLGKKLKKTFKNVWLNNAGLDGVTTRAHIVLVEDYLIKLKPRMIIFLIGCNDKTQGEYYAFDHRYLAEEIKNKRTFVNNFLDELEIGIYLKNFIRFFKGWHVFHRSIDFSSLEHINPNENRVNDTKKVHQQNYLPLYEKRLEKLISLCLDHGIEPVFLTQPTLLGEGFDDVTHINLATIKIRGLNSQGEWEILELYNEVLRKVCLGRGVLCIDLGRELPKSTKYFYDFYHYTNEGTMKVADIVYTYLAPFIQENYKDSFP